MIQIFYLYLKIYLIDILILKMILYFWIMMIKKIKLNNLKKIKNLFKVFKLIICNKLLIIHIKVIMINIHFLNF